MPSRCPEDRAGPCPSSCTCEGAESGSDSATRLVQDDPSPVTCPMGCELSAGRTQAACLEDRGLRVRPEQRVPAGVGGALLPPGDICSGRRRLRLLHLAGEGLLLSPGGSGRGVRGSGGPSGSCWGMEVG